MTRISVFVFALLLAIASSCAAPKPAYKTASGRKKLKYYNNLQFGGDKNVKFPKN